MPKFTLLLSAIALFLLSIVSAFYFRINPSARFEQKKLERYIHQQQQDFNSFLKDSSLIQKLIQRRESLPEYEAVLQKKYGIFLYAETLSEEHELFFWNNQNVIPPGADYTLADGEYFKQFPNGYYVLVKQTIQMPAMTNNVIAYALIPVLYRFDFKNSSYLTSQFAHDRHALNKIDISENPTEYMIQSVTRKPLFYIDKKAYTPIKQYDSFTAFVRILAFVLLLAYIHFLAERVVRKHGSTRGIIFLVL
ncbi:MAG TPA: hypothetical protein VM843_09530, partial [Flavisolibacter sp.]|nr:hypothetical protein [Flavisolibacter sp.]